MRREFGNEFESSEGTLDMGTGISDGGTGENLLFARALAGKECLLKSKGWIGLVRVERVVADVRHVAMWLTPIEAPGLPVGPAEPFVFSGPGTAIYRSSWEFGLSCGYGMDYLIHHPQVIESVLEMVRGGATRRMLLDALNHGEGLPEALQAQQCEFPRFVDAERRRARAALAWTGWEKTLAVQLSDLPAPAPALLSWASDSPAHLFLGLVSHVDGPRKDIAQHLLTSDRAYRANHPGAWPVIEETPERLFAHKQAFAMFYATRFEDQFLSAAMSNDGFVRTIKYLAEYAGWDFGVLALPSEKVGLSDGTFSGRSFAIEL